MEKQLSVLGYWLGILCMILALITRLSLAFDIVIPRLGSSGGIGISYLSFLHGAVLFFLLAIASWTRTAKP